MRLPTATTLKLPTVPQSTADALVDPSLVDIRSLEAPAAQQVYQLVRACRIACCPALRAAIPHCPLP